MSVPSGLKTNKVGKQERLPLRILKGTLYPEDKSGFRQCTNFESFSPIPKFNEPQAHKEKGVT